MSHHTHLLRAKVGEKASRVGDGFVTNVCQPGCENAASASASVSFEPMSYQRPGTRHA